MFTLIITMILSIIAICNTPCSENMECTSPNTCTCTEGWEGKNCLSGIVQILHLIVIVPVYFVSMLILIKIFYSYKCITHTHMEEFLFKILMFQIKWYII